MNRTPKYKVALTFVAAVLVPLMELRAEDMHSPGLVIEEMMQKESMSSEELTTLPAPAIVFPFDAPHCASGDGCTHGPNVHSEFTCRKSAAVADGGPAIDNVGDAISYTVVATNIGFTALTIVSVRDTMVPLSGPPLPTVLAPGTSITFQGTYLATGADLQLHEIKNTATITSKEAGAKACSATVPVKCLPGDFKCTKKATIADGGDAVDEVGDVVNYTVVITNTGDKWLTVQSIRDTLVPLTGPRLPSLVAPGASMTYSGKHVVSATDLQASILENTVTITTQEAGIRTCCEKVPVRLLPVDFKCDKTAVIVDGQDAVDEAGDKVDYTVIVTNTGKIRLTVQTVRDTMVALKGPKLPWDLAPGESVSLAGTYLTTAADLERESLENVVTITTREAGTRTCCAKVKVSRQCPKCECKDCCRWVQDEFARPRDVRVEKGYTVYGVAEKTVPFCCNDCTKDKKCIEVLGTKTVRQFVQRKVLETVVEQEPEVCTRPQWKCLKCGVVIDDDCPGERPHAASMPDATTTLSQEPLLSSPKTLLSAVLSETGADRVFAIGSAVKSPRVGLWDAQLAALPVATALMLSAQVTSDSNPIRCRLAP